MTAACLAEGPTPVGEALRWLDDWQAQNPAYLPGLAGVRADLLAAIGRFDQARSLLSEASAWVAERGLTVLAAEAMQAAYDIEMFAGDAPAAERAARQGWAMMEQLGDRNAMSLQACRLAYVLYVLGRYEESGRWARRGLELGGGGVDFLVRVWAGSVQSRLLARDGDFSAALTLAVEVDRLARTSDCPWDQGEAALSLAEVLYLSGDRTRAEEMTRRALDCYRRKGATARAAQAQRLAAGWASGNSAAPQA